MLAAPFLRQIMHRYSYPFYPYISRMRKNFTKAWTKAAEQHKITAIAVPFGNDTHVITPRKWAGMRLWVMTQEYYEELKGRRNSPP